MNGSIAQLVARSRMRTLPPPSQRRAIRRDARITQEEMAAALNVTHQAISQYEAGTRHPRGELLEKYADLLDRLAAVTKERSA